jgi:hypothetical protein
MVTMVVAQLDLKMGSIAARTAVHADFPHANEVDDTLHLHAHGVEA